MNKLILRVGLLLFNIALAAGSVSAQDQFSYLAEVTADGVNIRSGQSASFERLGRLKKGAVVVVTEKNNEWLKIKLPVDAVSYVKVDLIKDMGSSIGKVLADRVNIRAGAGVNFSSLGQLKKGEWVRLLGKENEWYKIEPLDRSFGWVMAEYVTFKSRDIPPARVVALPSRSIYKKRLAAQQPEAAVKAPSPPSDIITLGGWVQGLGDAPAADDIRHKIITDDQQVYFLKGYRNIVDGFMNYRVRLEGKSVSAEGVSSPVLLVTKINLSL